METNESDACPAGKKRLKTLAWIIMLVASLVMLAAIVLMVRSFILDSLNDSSLPPILGSVGSILYVTGVILLFVDKRKNKV